VPSVQSLNLAGERAILLSPPHIRSAFTVLRHLYRQKEIILGKIEAAEAGLAESPDLPERDPSIVYVKVCAEIERARQAIADGEALLKWIAAGTPHVHGGLNPSRAAEAALVERPS
jgi:hypothetical protein